MNQLTWLRATLAGLTAFVIGVVSAHGRQTFYDNYVWLARAFLKGRIAIDWPGPYIDALPFRGEHWVIEGPFPALLALPFVAVFHDANQTLIALALAAVAVSACWVTCERLGLGIGKTAWITAFLFAGTQLWWCAMLGDVWFLAHVAAVACTFVALAELVGPRRGWVVGLAATAATFSRFGLVLAVPVYAWLLWCERSGNDRRRALVGFAAVLGLGALLWVAYNLARWGVWYDIGYTAWYHQDEVGSPVGSPFQLRYLPMQVQAFFLQGVGWYRRYPWVVPGLGGVALTLVSPAFVIALFARRPRGLAIGLWLAALLVAGPSFIYYVTGYAQFGMRHALDFAPFLVVLMALAVRTGINLFERGLIVWSILVSSWGVWFWNTFYRAGN
jgi:hypothetical protein